MTTYDFLCNSRTLLQSVRNDGPSVEQFAASVAEFAVQVQMQAVATDRDTAIQSLQHALLCLPSVTEPFPQAC